MEEPNKLAAILKALHFAADKHRDQRRKDVEASPYINHPIEVAELLARVGGVTDLITLQSAILHDTIEDTKTKPEELEAAFGPEVRKVVEEVTDDKQLPKEKRKQLQIEHASHLSERAKQIKIGDKISNVLKIRVTGLGQFASLIQGVELNTKYGVSKKPGWAEGDSLKNYA